MTGCSREEREREEREKLIHENAFERKKKKPGLKLNLGLSLIGLRNN